MSLNIKNKRSAVQGSAPTPAQLEDGEIGVNYNANDPALYVKDSAGAVIRLAGEGAVAERWEQSGNDLYPKVATSDVKIGGTLPGTPNISLNADGTATFNGYVGIGITVPDKPLVVYGAGAEVVINDTDDTPSIRFRNSGTTSGSLAMNTLSDMSFRTGGNTEQMRIKANGDFVMGGTIPSSPNFALRNDGTAEFTGNVGIGTDSPTAKLEVNEAGNGSTSVELFRSRVTDGTNNPMLRVLANEADNLITLATSGSNSNSELQINTTSTQAVRINNNGNVGIGTDSPLEALSIDKGASSSIRLGVTGGTAYRLRANVSSTVNSGFLIEDAVSGNDLYRVQSGSAGDHRFLIDGSEKVRINPNGNVGIGTNNPQARLQVRSNPIGIPAPGVAGSMQVGEGAGFGLMLGANASGDGYLQAQRNDGATNIYDLLLQPNGGNVGIGTTNPQAKLDVDGSAAFTGDVECTDNTTGLILKSPNGTRYRLFVDNTGFLSTQPA